MSYFDQETIRFFEELAGNNKRERFHTNKKRYETHVKKPFQHLIKDLIEKISDEDPRIRGLEVKHAMFRINRDIRFSKDKSPYKTWMAAVISPGGRKNMLYPGIYVQVGRDGLKIAGGCYRPDRDQLYALRSYITKNLKQFEKIITDPDFVEMFGSIRGEAHKRIPKEFKKIFAKQPLIANKQFFYMAEYGPAHIVKDDLLNFVVQHFFAQENVIDFLRKALKSFL